MEKLNHGKWSGTTYGNGLMHRWLIRLLRVTDVRLMYAFAALFVIPPTMLVNGRAAKAIYRFYRHGLMNGRWRSAWLTYANHCAFARIIIDKFAMYAGRKFRMDITGYEKFASLAEKPGGFIQLSSHIGGYEIAGYSLVAETKRFNALIFGGEKESVMANRERLFSGNNIRMITMQPDMSHLFTINRALDNGEILSMAADRIFGSQKSFTFDFLGRPAQFPQGPFVIAAMKEVPVLFVCVMKSGAGSYRIIVNEVNVPEGTPGRKRAEALAREYVRQLEEVVRLYPTQWFNYYNFWDSDGNQ